MTLKEQLSASKKLRRRAHRAIDTIREMIPEIEKLVPQLQAAAPPGAPGWDDAKNRPTEAGQANEELEEIGLLYEAVAALYNKLPDDWKND